MEVEVREEAGPPPDSTALLVNNTPAYPVEDKPELIVRAEEVIIVVLFLMIWVAAIALFFNRWGQIRTLEPYQPKFQQNHHRTSCPLVPLSPPHITPQQRMSFSKYNVNCFSDNFYAGIPSPNLPRRARLNSVFVGSSTMAVMNTPPRRAKSAMDIQHLIVNEKRKRPSISGFSSMLPMISCREKRPSITIDRPSYQSRHRTSMAFDRPMLSHYHHPRTRRMSCFVDRRHKNFISFDQSERKSSITIDKSSSNTTQPTVSFDTTPSVSFDQPTVIVEHAEINHVPSTKTCFPSPKISRSFEHQPTRKIELISSRISTSLDVHTTNTDKHIEANCVKIDKTNLNTNMSSLDKSSSISEEGVESPAIAYIDDTQITAPLLEGLKSSDV